MKKILFGFFFVSILFSCINGNKEYANNLEHFKNLINDINTYFIDSTLESLKISNYYTEDFIFNSYPVGHKKGVKTSKTDYINNLRDKLVGVGEKQVLAVVGIGGGITLDTSKAISNL